MLHLRGIGVIDVRQHFGLAAYREAQSIDLLIERCTARPENTQYEALGLDDSMFKTINGIALPWRPLVLDDLTIDPALWIETLCNEFQLRKKPAIGR